MPNELKFVRNEKKYWDFIRNLRNNLNKSGAFIQDIHITEEMQNSYMATNNDCFFVCLSNERPAGYIGVVDNDIRVAVNPTMSGQGVGTFMLEELKKYFPNATARVLAGNDASFKLFEKSGFKLRWYYFERE